MTPLDYLLIGALSIATIIVVRIAWWAALNLWRSRQHRGQRDRAIALLRKVRWCPACGKHKSCRDDCPRIALLEEVDGG